MLLKKLFRRFEIIAPEIEEKNFETAQETVEKLSILKALNVYEKVSDAIVIGADTIVEVDGNILGKPENNSEARCYLRMLSNRSHIVHTAVAVVSRGEVWTKYRYTTVKFRKIPDEFLDSYISIYSFDKAGGYGIQDLGGVLVEGIDGDLYTVMGLPIGDLWEYFYSKGWWSFETEREDAENWI
ncbi:MAG: nucleoside triphosphate pyrophosphatase [Pseudothermotoga sp.]|jgi:septum formation protein|nr:nucleoside triphosphate pyrophosphatase [Pseudothermotoga sp.]MDK2884013.1 nucleoside triphosphate pyrophosphatase [Pseudothermotoga sp.]